jgi:hypothetical protein
MATVYFGAQYSNIPMNGNWSDVTQWFSTIGEDYGKGGIVYATPLNRLPNPATDTVLMYQTVTQGVGTYTGNIGNGYFGDPNAIWSGDIEYGYYYKGTFTGRIIQSQSFFGLHRFNGGNFTNATFVLGAAGGLGFGENLLTGDTTVYTLTLPNNFSITTKGQVSIYRQMNWTYPIYFNPTPSTEGNRGQLNISRGIKTLQLPTISIDISTSATGCRFFDLDAGGYDSYTPPAPVSLNTFLTNPAPLVFGTPTTPAGFNFRNIGADREVTVYTTRLDGAKLFNSYIGANFPTVYDKLNIIELDGPGFIYPNVIYANSNVTWRPTLSLPLNNVAEGTKYKLNENKLPWSYTFGLGGSTFDPIINISLTKNIAADL